MGGAIALTLAAENREDVVAVSTDCSFASLKDVVGVRINRKFPFLKSFGSDSIMPLYSLFLESICLMNKAWFGYDLDAVGPKKVLNEIKVPLLIMHSELDDIVPLDQALQIYQGVSSKVKKLFVAKQAEHIGSYYLNQKEYLSRQVEFLNQCFTECNQEDNKSIFMPDYEVIPTLLDNKIALDPEKTNS